MDVNNRDEWLPKSLRAHVRSQRNDISRALSSRFAKGGPFFHKISATVQLCNKGRSRGPLQNDVGATFVHHCGDPVKNFIGTSGLNVLFLLLTRSSFSKDSTESYFFSWFRRLWRPFASDGIHKPQLHAASACCARSVNCARSRTAVTVICSAKYDDHFFALHVESCPNANLCFSSRYYFFCSIPNPFRTRKGSMSFSRFLPFITQMASS